MACRSRRPARGAPMRAGGRVAVEWRVAGLPSAREAVGGVTTRAASSAQPVAGAVVKAMVTHTHQTLKRVMLRFTEESCGDMKRGNLLLRGRHGPNLHAKQWVFWPIGARWRMAADNHQTPPLSLKRMLTGIGTAWAVVEKNHPERQYHGSSCLDKTALAQRRAL